MVISQGSIKWMCFSRFLDEKFEQAKKFKQAIQELLKVWHRSLIWIFIAIDCCRSVNDWRDMKPRNDKRSKWVKTLKFDHMSLVLFKDEDYEIAQNRKEKMELYRAETYKQLQMLNLLDVVIVSIEHKQFWSSFELIRTISSMFPLSIISRRKAVKERNFWSVYRKVIFMINNER